MAVEVDRLVQENTNLKEDVKDIANMKVDRLNYEKQIGDLMKRMQELQAENANLKRENDKLNSLLGEANRKIDQLQKSLGEKDAELMDVKLKLEDITGGDQGMILL